MLNGCLTFRFQILETALGPGPFNKTNQTNKHMKRYQTTKSLLAGAALAGILTGGAVSTVNAATSTGADKASASAPGVLADEKKGETHDCKGKNSCKGKGGCKSGENGCAGKNSCKGKGGCAVKDGVPTHEKEAK